MTNWIKATLMVVGAITLVAGLIALAIAIGPNVTGCFFIFLAFFAVVIMVKNGLDRRDGKPVKNDDLY